MRQKKSKIILIVIILLVILILLSGIAYAYFATDALKSNKDLFFKYMTQIADTKEGFIETQLKEYFEKQKNIPYIDEGSISVNITASNDQEQFKNANEMNITFNGQVDTANSQVTQDISLNYSNRVKFPLSYKQIGDTIGIQTSYIGSKYITVNSSSEDLISENIQNFKKIQKSINPQLAEEDLKRIKDIYLSVLSEQLQDSSFSKIEETNSKGYQLTLNGERLKSILVKLLETLKNDQETLDKINEYIQIQNNSLNMTTGDNGSINMQSNISEITASDIDNTIKDINNDSELNNENLVITVYQTKGKTNRIFIKTNEIELKLEKILTGNDLQYIIELQDNDNNQTSKIGLITKFTGLQSMQNITENYELTLEMEEVKYQYHYNNNIEFTNSTNIETFNDSNSLLLNEMDEEQIATFINAIIERIQNVNESQMQELGLGEDENPIQYLIPQLENYPSDINTINISNQNEEKITDFNSKFENYESTNLKGVTVKGLLSTIQLSNESSEEIGKIEEIHFDGEEYEVTEQNIAFLKSSVETETEYRVEFERDEDTGIIYRAVINKK